MKGFKTNKISRLSHFLHNYGKNIQSYGVSRKIFYMSVNLHLCIEVKGFDRARLDAIENSIRELIAQEGLSGEFGKLEISHDRSGNERLRIQTDRRYPVIITRSYLWLPDMEQRLTSAVLAANGSPCQVEFFSSDADEGGGVILWED
jgi:hypothetical protein